jgi:hypothetical protein
VSEQSALKGCAFSFAVGHAAIECEFEPELEDIARSYVQFGGQAFPPAGAPAVFVVVRREHAVSPASRGLPVTCAFGDIVGYTEPGRVELWDGSSLVVAELDGRAVRASIGPESDWHVVGAVMLFVATALALRAHGLFHLHAGCVDLPGLGTVLVVGESGAGKTTLSLGLAALGGALVSDDSVFLGKRLHGDIEISGWPADLHLAPVTLGAFPDLASRAYRPVSDGRDKQAVPLDALARPWLPAARSPRLVLFPTVGRVSRSLMRRLGDAEIVARLIPQSGLVLVPGAVRGEEHLQLLADLAGAAIGLELTLGTDALSLDPAFLKRLEAATEKTESIDEVV